MKTSRTKTVLGFVKVVAVVVLAQLAGQVAWNLVLNTLLTDTAEGAK